MTAIADHRRLRVLVLYDPHALATNFVRDHLTSFREHLPHDVWYAAATDMLPVQFRFDRFDAIAIHFCIRVAFGNHMSLAFTEALRQFRGLKLLFIQDEYDMPLLAARWVRETGVQVVFTCVPARDREVFYPRDAIGDVTFVHTLTGYVSSRLAAWPATRPIAERPIAVGYRGRELPFRYGRLAREKVIIGNRMHELCHERRVTHDIACGEGQRLRGDAWFEFLENCRVMLGTESGSNVVNSDGTLGRAIDAALAAEPDLTFECVHERFLRSLDGQVRMNQVPPKLFEAIALRTALVLFEGEYSGVVRPDEHFIALRKDFRNVDDVFARIADVAGLQAMADRAHRDAIASGRYGYSMFVDEVAKVIERFRPAQLATGRIVTGGRRLYLRPQRVPSCSAPTAPKPLLRGWARRQWLSIPAWIRWPIRVVARPPVAAGVALARLIFSRAI